MLSEKVALTTVILGGVGIAGFGGYKVLSPKTIKDQLIFYGRETVLDEWHIDKWKRLVEKYNSEGTKPFGELKNSDQPDTQQTASMEKLQDKCLELLRTQLTDTDIKTKIQQTKDWCLLSSQKLIN